MVTPNLLPRNLREERYFLMGPVQGLMGYRTGKAVEAAAEGGGEG